jgi:ssDNA-binding Zn-finger/Zn-ribbon topoisomerase 1
MNKFTDKLKDIILRIKYLWKLSETVIHLDSDDSEQLTDIICACCGGKLRKVTGKYGDFFGCINYPRCTYTMSDSMHSKALIRKIKDLKNFHELVESMQDFHSPHLVNDWW